MAENGWAEHQRLVLSELKRLTEEVKDLNDRITNNMPSQNDYERLEDDIRELRKETIEQGKSITALQVKAGLYGAAAGFALSILVAVAKMLF